MKAIIMVDPLSKFTEAAIKEYEDRIAKIPGLEWEYVTYTTHQNMEHPDEHNLKLEKEGPEGWVHESPELLAKLADADYLFTCMCGVTEEMLRAGKKLKMVFIMRSGVENINMKAANELGITVCNTPSRLAEPVSDLAIALMIMEARGVIRGINGIKEGKFLQKDIYADRSSSALCNVRIGLWGYGGVARSIARKLVKGFESEVVAYDEFCTPESIEADGVKPVSLEELLSTSDIVSLHLRLVEATKGIMGKKEFDLMKSNAILINTARAGLVDKEACLEALQSKKIRGAAMDVFWDEPIPLDSPFLAMNNVIITPHIAGISSDMVLTTINMMVAEMQRYVAGEPLKFQCH